LITLKNISKYTLDDFSLNIKKGEILSLLGSSGSGKTTLLRIIAGFEIPDSGEVYINDKLVVSDDFFEKPEKRKIGLVFQDYALFPHLNIFDNVAFGLFNLSKKEQKSRAKEMIELVGLNTLEYRYPHEISGGQQQRVALARALAIKPEIILLDEPFSNLDEELKNSLRIDMKKILKEIGITAILVTHDKYDSLSIADRLALLNEGRLEQIATPEDIYEKPLTKYTANFFGKTNIYRASIKESKLITEIGIFEFKNDDSFDDFYVSIKPQHIQIVPYSNISAKIESIVYFGDHIEIISKELKTDKEIFIKSYFDKNFSIGDTINLQIDAENISFIN